MRVFSRKAERFGTICAVSLAVGTVGALSVTPAAAQVAVKQSVAGVEAYEGKLADGTGYMVRKPANWNGIMVRDLDGILRGNSKPYQMLLTAGYATASAERRSYDRGWTLNRLDDARRVEEAAAIFQAKFGKPRLVIAFGRSAGGATALVTAERNPNSVDGAVAMCTAMDVAGYAVSNLVFDLFYSLKVLLAPNDGRLVTHALPRNSRQIIAAWNEVLGTAAATPEGRARIALAFAIAQAPLNGPTARGDGYPKPDFNDPQAVTDTMVKAVRDYVGRLRLMTVIGPKDFPANLPIRGTVQPNTAGNDGAVYADYWKGADPAYKRVAEAMYAKAGLNLMKDIGAIDAAPRARINRKAFQDGLVGRGLPGVPVFRIDNLGDRVAPSSAGQLYDAMVEFNGLAEDYRTAFVDESGHCYFRPEQEVAAIEVMRERLETGKWPATDAAALNTRANATPGAGKADRDGRIFVEHRLGAFSGTWRLKTHTDAFRPATFATAAALVRSQTAGSQRELLLRHLADAKDAARHRNAAVGNSLDRFAAVARDVPDRAVRTRLLAASHQLRGAVN